MAVVFIALLAGLSAVAAQKAAPYLPVSILLRQGLALMTGIQQMAN